MTVFGCEDYKAIGKNYTCCESCHDDYEHGYDMCEYEHRKDCLRVCCRAPHPEVDDFEKLTR